MNTKKCVKCGETKDKQSGYARCRRASDGVQSWCKACHAAYRISRRGYRPPRRPRELKWCSYGAHLLPLDAFHFMGHSPDQRQGYCKRCMVRYATTRRRADPAYRAARNRSDRRYYRRLREEKRAQRRLGQHGQQAQGDADQRVE